MLGHFFREGEKCRGLVPRPTDWFASISILTDWVLRAKANVHFLLHMVLDNAINFYRSSVFDLVSLHWQLMEAVTMLIRIILSRHQFTNFCNLRTPGFTFFRMFSVSSLLLRDLAWIYAAWWLGQAPPYPFRPTNSTKKSQSILQVRNSWRICICTQSLGMRRRDARRQCRSIHDETWQSNRRQT